MNLAQAAEVYHRLFHSTQTELAEDEHKKRLDEILDEVSDVRQDWLRAKLEYSNELRFGQRIKAILNETKSIVQALLPNSKTRKGFTFKVPRARNDLTHRLKTTTKDEDLYVMAEVLFPVLSACMLIRSGIPEDRVAAILGNTFRYLRAAENSFRFG